MLPALNGAPGHHYGAVQFEARVTALTVTLQQRGNTLRVHPVLSCSEDHFETPGTYLRHTGDFTHAAVRQSVWTPQAGST